jgi:hypothetical protein
MHLKELFPIEKTHYPIPIYINAHSLQKTDISGNHQTTYEKLPKPNPKFLGKTLHETLIEHNPQEFGEKYKVSYTFDGDTIEFMTQNYYKADVVTVISELLTQKKQFITAINDAFQTLNIFKEYGPVKFPVKNEPFVSYLTNKANIGIFNNGTYHINITLPTQLGPDSQPLDEQEFIKKHKSLIRYIQYLEPFLIAKYGTPDPFSQVSPKYSKSSQRCAVSRYIGIGTYDTDKMPTGKILTIDKHEIKQSALEYWWYNQYQTVTNYIPLPKVGVDINFRKHGVHGIEIRFFDWFPEANLGELLSALAHLCDFSLEKGCPENPINDPIWNGFVLRSLQQGNELDLDEDEYRYFTNIFKILDSNKRNIIDVYESIAKSLSHFNGECTKLFLKEPGSCC